MTLIAKYANALKMFFTSWIRHSEGQQFKIFIRTGFQIDVYLFVHDCQNFKDVEKKFDSYCKNTPVFSDLKPVEGNDYIRIFFNVLPVSDLEDPFYFNIANAPNDIDRGPRYRFDSFYSISKYDLKKLDQTKIPVVTFYSHKGGVGRTTAMTSYALHLAKEGKTVAIIDCDLEAPGYLNFFGLSEHEELLEGKKNGLVEFLCDSQFLGGNDIDINNYMLNVGARNRGDDYQPALNRIWLIPAGNLNEGVTEKNALKSQGRRDYLEGLAKLNLGNTQKVVKGFTSLFEQLRSIDVDVILIDSRTGFNDIFGTATLHLSSCVVGFFGLSRQNEPGIMNLLANHINNNDLFKLILAYSILPENFEKDSVLKQAFDRMESFIMDVYAEKEAPPRIPIHRNAILERLGTGDDDADEKFIDMNTAVESKNQFQDYVQLFDEIDRACFPQKSRLRIAPSKPTKEYGSFALRNIVLQHLKKVLADAAMPAENIDFNPDTFYFRSCMHEKSGFFDRDKFVICGRKGTGKTHFCKVVKNKRVLAGMRELDCEEFFIDALTNERKDYMYLIQAVKYMFVKKEDFLNFWRICLWAKLMFDESIEGLSGIRAIVKQQSKLTHEYDDNIFVSAAFVELMDVDKLLNIVKDIHRFNEELDRANKTIYILYDHLESFIQPEYWNEAISSLINYWTGLELSRIFPKIFIRPDLLSQVENLNTELSPDNILNIEWSIEEVFGYFFKLVFSDSAATNAFWTLAETLNVDSYYIHEMKKKFETSDGLYIGRSRVEMENLIRVFFGSDTKKYGKPWDYFKKELSNADYTVNLQAFINVLNKNVVDKALAIAESEVTEIISPDIYTSTEVRTLAVTELFKSYMTDAFCKDLVEFQYVVLYGNSGMFRYKSLDGMKFESLIDETCKRIDVSNTGNYKARLISLIFANGIMSMEHTTRGDVFNFAPLYWFPWGLQDELSDDDAIHGNKAMDGRLAREMERKSEERYYKEREEERKAEEKATLDLVRFGTAAVAAGAAGALGLSGLGIPVVAAASALGIAPIIAKKLLKMKGE